MNISRILLAVIATGIIFTACSGDEDNYKCVCSWHAQDKATLLTITHLVRPSDYNEKTGCSQHETRIDRDTNV